MGVAKFQTVVRSLWQLDIFFVCMYEDQNQFFRRFSGLASILQKMPILHCKNEVKIFKIPNLRIYQLLLLQMSYPPLDVGVKSRIHFWIQALLAFFKRIRL